MKSQCIPFTESTKTCEFAKIHARSPSLACHILVSNCISPFIWQVRERLHSVYIKTRTSHAVGPWPGMPIYFVLGGTPAPAQRCMCVCLHLQRLQLLAKLVCIDRFTSWRKELLTGFSCRSPDHVVQNVGQAKMCAKNADCALNPKSLSKLKQPQEQGTSGRCITRKNEINSLNSFYDADVRVPRKCTDEMKDSHNCHFQGPNQNPICNVPQIHKLQKCPTSSDCESFRPRFASPVDRLYCSGHAGLINK